MKDYRNLFRPSKTQSGIATLEMLIALTILVLSITAVILLVFGGQSVTADTQTNNEALYKAQELLERARALSREDFNLVNPVPATNDDIYQKSVDVETLPDFLPKRLTSNVTWTGDHNRQLSITLSTLLTSPSGYNNGLFCNSVLTNPGGWKNPIHYEHESTDLVDQASGNNSDGLGISDLAVLNQRIYIAADAVANNNDNFYISSLPNDPIQWPAHQGYMGSVDTNQDGSGGLAAVVTAPIDNKIYAFVANTSSVASKGQLQIIDVTSPTPTGWNPAITRYTLPTVSTTKLGSSIFYSNGYIYLGLTATANGGTEFNVIDVGGGGLPASPTNPIRKGGYFVGNTVNSIFVRGDYAYIATPNTENMTIIDISVPTDPQRVGGSPSLVGGNNGESVYAVGTNVYLGRTFGSNEFYILNATDLANVSITGTQDVGTGSQTSVNGLAVRDYLAFFMTKAQFQVWNISSPGSITPWTSDNTTNSFLTFSDFISGNGNSITGSSLFCAGNNFYISIKTPQGQNKDVIWILTAGP